MRDDPTIRRLNAEIDRMLGPERGAPPTTPSSPAGSPDLQTIASWLARADFQPEIRPQPALRARWASRHLKTVPPSTAARPAHGRWAWAIFIVGILLMALFIFRQPVLAAVGHLFGYGYFPEVGFVPLDGAQVLLNPVRQEHDGRRLTVLRGLATPKETNLWLEYSDTARPVDGAWLESDTGSRQEILSWQFSPNTPDTRGIRVTFPALPTGASQTTLALPEGWRLPLTWLPATQSNLPDVRIVPYQEPNAEPTQASATPTDLCRQQHGLTLCLLAATASPENTSVLVKAQSAIPKLVPGDLWQGLVWSTEAEPVILRDAQGNTFPLNGQQADTLIFPPLAAGEHRLTLTVPAILATVDIPDQTIRVDMGADPQPDQVLSLDADVQVLDTTVRFRKATFIGDGVNSLRLTLDAEPPESVNGVTPIALEMSKPDRVDDLYGSGNLAGSKDLFVELVRPQGKINGVLELPVVKATVAIAGPFEFTFSLSQTAPQVSPTPAEADPGAFSPAPTPTPLALDTYRFSGRLPQPGDLLFTALEGETTILYAANPGHQFEPEPIATLPGQVYQVFVHPDRLGIDYLAGTRVTEDGFTFYRRAQVYTLRFDDSRPSLLAAFPRGPENVKGTELIADWSYDGQLMVFQLSNFMPKQGETPFQLGWLDLSCRQTGNCQPQLLDLPKGLSVYDPRFSPNDHRLLMPGSYIDGRGSGAGDIFLLEFGPQGTPGEVINLSDSDQIDELVPRWDPQSEQVVALCPTDPSEAQRQFCFYDPATMGRQAGADIDQHLFDYQVAPDGSRVLGLDINHQATSDEDRLEFRLFDWSGKSGALLAGTAQVDRFAQSPDGSYFAYLHAETSEMHLVDIATGQEPFSPGQRAAGRITWLGWIQ